MPELRDAARDAFAIQKNRIRMPWWLPALGIGVAVIVGVWALIPPKGDPKLPTFRVDEGPVLSVPGDTTPVGGSTGTVTPGPPVTSPGTMTPTPRTGSKVMDDAGGAQVTVEQAAYDEAVAGLLAELGAGATIVTEIVQARSEDSITFTFTATPAGATTPTVKAVTVGRSGSAWSRR